MIAVEGAMMMRVSPDLRSSPPDDTRFVLVRRADESTPPATLRVLFHSLAQLRG